MSFQSFGPGPDGTRTLRLELVGEHIRVAGSVDLGSHSRLSDLVNFQLGTMTLADAVVLTRTGHETADHSPALDVVLDTVTLVIDRSGYVPPTPGTDLAVEKDRYRMLIVTPAHLISATLFTYSGVSPSAYLRGQEPRFIPLSDLRIRSLTDRRIKFRAEFALLNRRSVMAAGSS